MFCGKCGSQINAGNTFCTVCGTKLDGGNGATFVPQSQGMNVQQVVYVKPKGDGTVFYRVSVLVSVILQFIFMFLPYLNIREIFSGSETFSIFRIHKLSKFLYDEAEIMKKNTATFMMILIIIDALVILITSISVISNLAKKIHFSYVYTTAIFGSICYALHSIFYIVVADKIGSNWYDSGITAEASGTVILNLILAIYVFVACIVYSNSKNSSVNTNVYESNNNSSIYNNRTTGYNNANSHDLSGYI